MGQIVDAGIHTPQGHALICYLSYTTTEGLPGVSDVLLPGRWPVVIRIVWI
jgi:hypothetical protein